MIFISKNKACIGLLLAFAFIITIISLNALEVPKAASAPDTSPKIPLPIIMYHSVTSAFDQLGEYVINSSELERDLRYLKANGYETIFLSDIVDFQENPEKGFPYENPILLVFDDGFFNNYSVAYPLFKEFGMRFSISVVASYADKEMGLSQKQSEYYSYCTWPQLQEMQDSGYVQLINHTNGMHSIGTRMGALQKKSESDSDYLEAFQSDVSIAQEKLADIGAPYKFFAYPFGFYTKKTEQILDSMGFASTLSCADGINYITQSSSLKALRRNNRVHGIPSEKFFGDILREISP